MKLLLLLLTTGLLGLATVQAQNTTDTVTLILELEGEGSASYNDATIYGYAEIIVPRSTNFELLDRGAPYAEIKTSPAKDTYTGSFAVQLTRKDGDIRTLEVENGTLIVAKTTEAADAYRQSRD
ncbi:MAG: hypothetical protein AAGI08_12035 [Bacteroidota bacterium]